MTKSRFAEDLQRKFAAGFQAFGLSTLEPKRALGALAQFGRDNDLPVLSWSSTTGFRPLHVGAEDAQADRLAELANDDEYIGNPGGALDLLGDVYRVAHGRPRTPSRFLTVMIDMHTILADNPPLRTKFTGYHSQNWFVTTVADQETGEPILVEHPIVFMHPVPGLHPELDHLVEPLLLPLMKPAEIDAGCVEYIKESLGGDDTGLEGDDGVRLRRDLAGVCAGLLSHQIDDVLSLAAREGGTRGFDRSSLDVVRQYRAELINQSGLLKVYSGAETFKNIGGLGSLKRYVSAILSPKAAPLDRARGVLLMGVPGSGKSMITRALGNETGRVAIELNIGALMGGHVGESERNIRRALDVIDNSGKAILLLDEVEKALGGVESSGQSDGGALMRVFDEFLRWLNDHDSDVFTVMTSNDLSKLPPEFSRAGRFDSIWYVDLPSAQARIDLWRIYLGKYGLDPKQPRPDDVEYTGAEIMSVARQAYLMGVPLAEAAEYVTPVVKRSEARIRAMRDWAVGAGCLDAEFGGKYNPQKRKHDLPELVQKGRKIAHTGHPPRD